MIDLYTVATGNGQRAAIMLEECGLPYTAHKIDIRGGEQNQPAYRKIYPGQTMPAIIDHDVPGKPIHLGQSGAILLYLVEKTGKFLSKDPVTRAAALQWFMFATTDVAGTSGAFFQSGTVENGAAAKALFEKRLVGMFVIADEVLGKSEYLAGDYSIADMALFPVYHGRRAIIEAAADLPNLKRWGAAVGARPAVVRALKVPA